jgi:hypothetical protein
MDPGHRERVRAPTLEEITEATGAGREIVGCAGVAYRSMIVLRLACRNGDIATVCLNPVARSDLLRALIALSPEGIELRGAPVTDGPLGPTVQRGYQSVQP